MSNCCTFSKSIYFYCNLKSVKSIIFPLNFPFKLSAIVVLYQSSLHFLCCSTNLTFHVKLLFFTPTYFIHFLSWQSYFTEESLCDWNRYEIKLCFKIFVGAVFLSSSLSLTTLYTHLLSLSLWDPIILNPAAYKLWITVQRILCHSVQNYTTYYFVKVCILRNWFRNWNSEKGTD